MEPNRENDLDGCNQSIRPDKPRQKKPYSAPQFGILTPGQAKAVLTAKALPGEAATEQLLTSISQLEKSGRTHEERPLVAGRAETRRSREVARSRTQACCRVLECPASGHPA